MITQSYAHSPAHHSPTRRTLSLTFSCTHQLTHVRLDAQVAASPDNYVLIDCRTDAETSVSVIKGAMVQRDFERLDPLTSTELVGKTLVPYCTIGYRSGV